jgi:hypothetical protein
MTSKPNYSINFPQLIMIGRKKKKKELSPILINSIKSFYKYIPVTKQPMKPKNEIFFIWGNTSSLNRRPEIVHPSEAAALTTPKKPCLLWQCTPSPFTIVLDVVSQELIFFRCPRSSLYTSLATTWCGCTPAPC